MSGRSFRPNSTQVPNEIIDFEMSQLSDAEFKVLMYIVRRTLGFQKDGDHISLSQLVSGITRRDGTVLDTGTGMSKPAVLRGIKGLEGRNLICVRRDESAKGNKRSPDTSYYALNLDGFDSPNVVSSRPSNATLPASNAALPSPVTLLHRGPVTQDDTQNLDQNKEPKEDRDDQFILQNCRRLKRSAGEGAKIAKRHMTKGGTLDRAAFLRELTNR